MIVVRQASTPSLQDEKAIISDGDPAQTESKLEMPNVRALNDTNQIYEDLGISLGDNRLSVKSKDKNYFDRFDTEQSKSSVSHSNNMSLRKVGKVISAPAKEVTRKTDPPMLGQQQFKAAYASHVNTPATNQAVNSGRKTETLRLSADFKNLDKSL